VRQPTVSRLYVAPSYRTAAGNDAYALDVLAIILAGGSTSRLYKALVVDLAIAAGAGGYYWGTALDPSQFVLYAMPRPGSDLAAVEAAMDAEIGRLIEHGVMDGELERAKTRLIADTIYERDSQSALARSFGAALTTGLGIDDVIEWPDRVRAVTAADVLRVARATFDIRNAVTGWLESAPDDAAADEGDA
jgi:zinc protease